MASPYDELPPVSFWRAGAAEPAMSEIEGVYAPKFPVTRTMRIATQGSCFAQHIGREFARRGYGWFEAEPPLPAVPADVNARHNYGLFSYRTGNIYTTRLLLQWLRWASGEAKPPPEAWPTGGGVVDPFRPRIEPEPYPDADAMRAARRHTLARMGETLATVDLFVFTLGLTEGWEDRESGVAFPMCPGTVGGSFDAARHVFVNYRFADVVADLKAAIALLKRHNSAMKVLLTVSPVPLVATASGEHVIVANGRSKATLRAAAAELAETVADVDYFPSYELIREPPFGTTFFEANLRSVTAAGVAFVMGHFFRAHGDEAEPPAASARGRRQRAANAEVDDDLVCEEIMLDAASPR